MKAVKKGGKSLVNGESKGSRRQKIDMGREKERFCKALNHLTEEEIFQKSASPPAGDQESQRPSAPPTWSRNCDVKVGQGQGRLETTNDYLVFFILQRIFIM